MSRGEEMPQSSGGQHDHFPKKDVIFLLPLLGLGFAAAVPLLVALLVRRVVVVVLGRPSSPTEEDFAVFVFPLVGTAIFWNFFAGDAPSLC